MISILSDINQFAGLMRTDPKLLMNMAIKSSAAKGTGPDDISHNITNNKESKEEAAKATRKIIKKITNSGR